jgi:hypothetical protein
VCATAFHATNARAKLQFANIDIKDSIATGQQFVADNPKHLADIAVRARACVQDNKFPHCISIQKKRSSIKLSPVKHPRI